MRNISNVANHLRQGYGGQDVEVLPVPMLLITKKWEFNAELLSTKHSYPIPQNENLVRNILILDDKSWPICHRVLRP